MIRLDEIGDNAGKITRVTITGLGTRNVLQVEVTRITDRTNKLLPTNLQ